MANLKPDVDIGDVAALMEAQFGAPVRGLAPMEGGEVARTFAFTAGDGNYVVKFNPPMAATFEKEAFISRRYRSAAVPIPRIVHLGRFRDLRYAVSEQAPGSPLTALPPSQLATLMPALLDSLDAIHAADVGDATGHGLIGDDGNGLAPSWRDFLASANVDGPPGDYFEGWHRLFDTSFLDRAAFDRLYGEMEALLPYCPEERHLVHGDFGFGNVLAQDGRIAAVIDWTHALYGDPLYDVAWLDFWSAGADLAGVYHRRATAQGGTFAAFDERIRCYQAYNGLMAARFFTQANDEPAYRWVWTRLRELGVTGD